MNGVLLAAKALRAVTGGHFALRLDTASTSEITLLAERGGGSIYADVIAVSEAGLHFARKHLGNPKYEAFAVPVGAAMSKELFDWVAGSWGAQPQKRSGAVLGVDSSFNIKTEAVFAGALIVETHVPALDAASKEAGHLTVHFQPELIDVKPGAGKLSLAPAKQKLWRASNFRLQIDSLDCTKVSKIDAFSVTRKVATVSSGSGGGVSLVAEEVEFPNLRIALSQNSAKTWFDWHETFVVNGNNSDSFERDGSISFRSNDLKTELSRIDLHHLGIIRLTPDATDGGSQIARVTAELYCEEMVLSPGVNP